MTDRRERAYARLFGLLDAEPWFQTRWRGLAYPLDVDGLPTEVRDGFPALLFLDGGDEGVDVEGGSLGRDCAFQVTVAVEAQYPDQLPTVLNTAIDRALAALAGWLGRNGDGLLSTVPYQTAEGPFVASAGAPRAAMELRLGFTLGDPSLERLAL